MTNKTKKLFRAPWTSKRVKFTSETTLNRVSYKDGETLVPHVHGIENANRLSRLPELYDALVEAAYEFCYNCVSLTGDSEYVPDSDEFIEKGCPKKSGSCFCKKWWELLRNVRDGK